MICSNGFRYTSRRAFIEILASYVLRLVSLSLHTRCFKQAPTPWLCRPIVSFGQHAALALDYMQLTLDVCAAHGTSEQRIFRETLEVPAASGITV